MWGASFSFFFFLFFGEVGRGKKKLHLWATFCHKMSSTKAKFPTPMCKIAWAQSVMFAYWNIWMTMASAWRNNKGLDYDLRNPRWKLVQDENYVKILSLQKPFFGGKIYKYISIAYSLTFGGEKFPKFQEIFEFFLPHLDSDFDIIITILKQFFCCLYRF